MSAWETIKQNSLACPLEDRSWHALPKLADILAYVPSARPKGHAMEFCLMVPHVATICTFGSILVDLLEPFFGQVIVATSEKCQQ